MVSGGGEGGIGERSMAAELLHASCVRAGDLVDTMPVVHTTVSCVSQSVQGVGLTIK